MHFTGKKLEMKIVLLSFCAILSCVISGNNAFKIEMVEGELQATSTPKEDKVVYRRDYAVGSGEEVDALAQLKQVVVKVIGKMKLFNLPPLLDDDFLYRMIRCKNYHPKLAIEGMIDYYRSVSVLSKNKKFLKMVPSTYQAAFESKFFQVLSHQFEDTTVVLVDIEKVFKIEDEIEDFQMALLFQLEVLFRDENTQAHGITAIIDIEGLPFGTLHNYSEKLDRLINVVLKMYPMRLHQVRFFNGNIGYNTLRYTIKPWLREQTLNQIYSHNTVNEVMDLLNNTGEKMRATKFPAGAEFIAEAFGTERTTDKIKAIKCFDDCWKPSTSSIAEKPEQNFLDTVRGFVCGI